MTASQDAELERVTGTVPSLIRLWESVEESKVARRLRRDSGRRNWKFEIRKSEKQAGMTEKSALPFQKPKPKG